MEGVLKMVKKEVSKFTFLIVHNESCNLLDLCPPRRQTHWHFLSKIELSSSTFLKVRFNTQVVA
jgi:hypothetical protein